MRQKLIPFLLCMVLLVPGQPACGKRTIADARMVSLVAAPRDIRLFWKDEKGQVLGSLGALHAYVQRQGHQLLFATNGGMYQEDQSPQGLFIRDGRMVTPVNKVQNAYGNFYLQPNGIFYLTGGGQAVVCRTPDFRPSGRIRYATQSGPMLVINGAIHPQFKKGSENTNVRNGVGILPDGTVVLAMSRGPINLYDFAEYFQSIGCRNALYLDGFVSRTWYPAGHWVQEDGHFGVLIGVLKK